MVMKVDAAIGSVVLAQRADRALLRCVERNIIREVARIVILIWCRVSVGVVDPYY